MSNVRSTSSNMSTNDTLTLNHILCNAWDFTLWTIGSDGNWAVKIEGEGSAVLSLHCKDREYPSNFYVIPSVKIGNFHQIFMSSPREKSLGNQGARHWQVSSL